MSATSHSSLSPVKGLVFLIAVFAVIGIFIALSVALSIQNYWPGFLFLLYWAAIDQARLERLLPDATGALTGVALAYGLAVMQSHGIAVTVLVLLCLILAIYCIIMAWLPHLINTATMLFLTVGTIPAVSVHVPFAELAIALVLGIVYFGTLGALGFWLARGKVRRGETSK